MISPAAPLAKLPPVYWIAPVARRKPAAEVFLEDPSASPPRVTQNAGRRGPAIWPWPVMFIGTDKHWRWRKNKAMNNNVTLWARSSAPALPHLRRTKRTQLSLDKKEYSTNEKVTLDARLYTESYTPITQDKVKVNITDTGPDDPRARK